MNELFVKMPTKLLYDQRLTAKAKLLYAIITDLADANGCAAVTIPRLQYLLGARSDKTIRNLELELCRTGYITISHTGRASYIWIRSDDISGSGWSAIEQHATDTIRHRKEKSI